MLNNTNRFRGKKQCFYEWFAFILPPIVIGICFTIFIYPFRADSIIIIMILLTWLTALPVAYRRWKILYNMKTRLKFARRLKKEKYLEVTIDFRQHSLSLIFKSSTIYILIFCIYSGFSFQNLYLLLFWALCGVIHHLMFVKITKNQRERYIIWRNIFCIISLISILLMQTTFAIISIIPVVFLQFKINKNL
jgi:hypothetical protein